MAQLHFLDSGEMQQYNEEQLTDFQMVLPPVSKQDLY